MISQKTYMKTKKIFLIFFITISLIVRAQIRVSNVLTDNMVLQRNSEIKLWGTSTPNEKLTFTFGWCKNKLKTICNDKGEWNIKIQTIDAGGPYNVSIWNKAQKVVLKNILLGDVWLCSGQSNMEMAMTGTSDSPVNGTFNSLLEEDHDQIRLFTVKRKSSSIPETNLEGSWSIANPESIVNFSSVGYFFAKQLQVKLKVPIGVICSSWGGSGIEAWINEENMKRFPESLKKTTLENTFPNHRASNLYNGMINPIKNYAIKGVIWYQGEQNRVDYNIYSDLMNGLVQNWRNDFGVGDFPFYFVQIAPYNYGNSKDLISAKFWDEQFKASQIIPNCGMVCTTDLGEEFNIHPAEKSTIGKRLAAWALSETYGIKGIPHKNPFFKKAVVNDSEITLTFENSENGITSFGKELTNFEIAGDDRIFHPAKALIEIKKKQLRISSNDVKKPVAARYRYSNFPKGEGFLYNTFGLPVLPFRTDNWDK
jgi:sialate O-acetylesterase